MQRDDSHVVLSQLRLRLIVDVKSLLLRCCVSLVEDDELVHVALINA